MRKIRGVVVGSESGEWHNLDLAPRATSEDGISTMDDLNRQRYIIHILNWEDLAITKIGVEGVNSESVVEIVEDQTVLLFAKG